MLISVHLKSLMEGIVVLLVHVVVEVKIELVFEFSNEMLTFMLVDVLVSIGVHPIEGVSDHTSLFVGEVFEATDVFGMMRPVLVLVVDLAGDLDSGNGGSDKGSGFEHLFLL